MPGGDETGPNGMGSMTGRGMGYCNSFNTPGYANPQPGFGRGFRGRGMGFGRGFGFRRFANAPVQQQTQPVELSREEKLKILEADRKDIEAELEEIKKTIEKIRCQDQEDSEQ